MSELLILDLNGVLCYKGKLRPDYEKFLQYCYRRWRVGYFSSCTSKRGRKILDSMLTPDQQAATVCRWFRGRTRPDPEPVKSHDTIKLLSDLLNDREVNPGQRYHEGNTIICDDSPRKLRFNRPDNVVVVPEYTGSDDDVVLKTLGYEISERFRSLRRRRS